VTDLKEKAVHRFAQQAMGTAFEGLVAGCEIRYARQAVQAAFAEVERLESLFSRFNASSEVSQINRLKPGESMRIGIETFECLTLAEKMRQETAGAFDINFRSLLKSRRRAEEKGPGMILSPTNGFTLALEPAPSENGQACLDLDLGGIGKGYALDRAVEILACDWDVDRFLLHSGTSTAFAVGDAPDIKPDEEGWPVGAGTALGFAGPSMRLFLKNRALSGSGTEVKGHHIVDPRTGLPADRHLAAWVSHPRAAAADALSTAFMVMSLEEIERYCNGHPEVWALIISNTRARCVFNKEIFV
jgi:thiamine biosynthesis lipoprotein